MRVLMRVTVPVDAGNKGIKDGSLPRVIQQTMEEWKPEATYFVADGGKRTAYMFLDLKDSSVLPQISEPFFMTLNADVEFLPAMNPADLKVGLEALAKKM